MTTETRIKFETVQQGRHAVRDALQTAYRGLNEAGILYGLSDETLPHHEALVDLVSKTKEVRRTLRGFRPCSQEEQVSRLTQTQELVEDAKKLATTVAQSRGLTAEQKEKALAARDMVNEAKKANTAARNLAASRDFEAHLAAKNSY